VDHIFLLARQYRLFKELLTNSISHQFCQKVIEATIPDAVLTNAIPVTKGLFITTIVLARDCSTVQITGWNGMSRPTVLPTTR
jgi:hypothetical protein